MNLHEIEEALHTLITRHPGLDESMLVTLLRAGGWEERTIQEAVLMFRAGVIVPEATLPEIADTEHSLPSPDTPKEEIVVTASQSAPIPEPESLVVHPDIPQPKEDLPHNLPLRPFESSDHVWPFSRYRDVFYGEQVIQTPKPPTIEHTAEASSVPISSAPVISAQPPVERFVPYTPLPKADIPQHTDHTHGDEKLVVMAAIMLLAVLLLLGYMYSNGRL